MACASLRYLKAGAGVGFCIALQFTDPKEDLYVGFTYLTYLYDNCDGTRVDQSTYLSFNARKVKYKMIFPSYANLTFHIVTLLCIEPA